MAMDGSTEEKPRGRRFTKAEDLAVIEGAQKLNEFLSKPMNNNAVLKRQAWQQICEAVNATNANGRAKRTVQVVKRRYKDIRRAAIRKGVIPKAVTSYIISLYTRVGISIREHVTSQRPEPNQHEESTQLTVEPPAQWFTDLDSRQEEESERTFDVKQEPIYEKDTMNEDVNNYYYECGESSSNDQQQLPTQTSDSTMERMILVQERMANTLQEFVSEFRRDADLRRLEAANLSNILCGIRDGLLMMAGGLPNS